VLGAGIVTQHRGGIDARPTGPRPRDHKEASARDAPQKIDAPRACAVPGCPRVHKNADDAEVPGDTPSINDIPASGDVVEARARARSAAQRGAKM